MITYKLRGWIDIGQRKGFSPKPLPPPHTKKPPQGRSFCIWLRSRDSLGPSMALALRAARCAVQNGYPAVLSNQRVLTKAAPSTTYKKTATRAVFLYLAEREGFEPSIRGYRIHTFQACSFSHSDTSPKVGGMIGHQPVKNKAIKTKTVIRTLRCSVFVRYAIRKAQRTNSEAKPNARIPNPAFRFVRLKSNRNLRLLR